MEDAAALLVLAALVALVVVVPLRRGGEVERREHGRIAELRAAKEANYREIRDAELDHRMGKLSRADWRAVDRELRGEAIEILRELDRLEGRSPEEGEERRSPGEGERAAQGAGEQEDGLLEGQETRERQRPPV